MHMCEESDPYFMWKWLDEQSGAPPRPQSRLASPCPHRRCRQLRLRLLAHRRAPLLLPTTATPSPKRAGDGATASRLSLQSDDARCIAFEGASPPPAGPGASANLTLGACSTAPFFLYNASSRQLALWVAPARAEPLCVDTLPTPANVQMARLRLRPCETVGSRSEARSPTPPPDSDALYHTALSLAHRITLSAERAATASATKSPEAHRLLRPSLTSLSSPAAPKLPSVRSPSRARSGRRSPPAAESS